MSASEMERLKAAHDAIANNLRVAIDALTAESASLRERLREAEGALREIDCCEEHVCRLCDERINAVFRPHAAASCVSAAEKALRWIASLAGEDPEWTEECDEGTPAAVARAALSGGSAPQAPNQEELLKALRAAPHGWNCRSSRLNRIQQDTPPNAAFPAVYSFTFGEPAEEEHCNCWKRAALSMKSEGSDPDSSQKGEP